MLYVRMFSKYHCDNYSVELACYIARIALLDPRPMVTIYRGCVMEVQCCMLRLLSMPAPHNCNISSHQLGLYANNFSDLNTQAIQKGGGAHICRVFRKP